MADPPMSSEIPRIIRISEFLSFWLKHGSLQALFEGVHNIWYAWTFELYPEFRSNLTLEVQLEGSADLRGSCTPPQPDENGQLAFAATRLSPSPAATTNGPTFLLKCNWDEERLKLLQSVILSLLLEWSRRMKIGLASATRRSLMNLSTCNFNWVVLCKSASTNTCRCN